MKLSIRYTLSFDDYREVKAFRKWAKISYGKSIDEHFSFVDGIVEALTERAEISLQHYNDTHNGRQ